MVKFISVRALFDQHILLPESGTWILWTVSPSSITRIRESGSMLDQDTFTLSTVFDHINLTILIMIIIIDLFLGLIYHDIICVSTKIIIIIIFVFCNKKLPYRRVVLKVDLISDCPTHFGRTGSWISATFFRGWSCDIWGNL